MSKQTAVQWLAEKMMHPQIHNPYIDQALEMERQQIIDAYDKISTLTPEQYYTQTFTEPKND